jgi:hypothetical protein
LRQHWTRSLTYLSAIAAARNQPIEERSNRLESLWNSRRTLIANTITSASVDLAGLSRLGAQDISEIAHRIDGIQTSFDTVSKSVDVAMQVVNRHSQSRGVTPLLTTSSSMPPFSTIQGEFIKFIEVFSGSAYTSSLFKMHCVTQQSPSF